MKTFKAESVVTKTRSTDVWSEVALFEIQVPALRDWKAMIHNLIGWSTTKIVGLFCCQWCVCICRLLEREGTRRGE